MATEHYQLAMDSGNHMETYVPPFTIFSTVISNTHDAKYVMTCMISIKSSAKHHALL